VSATRQDDLTTIWQRPVELLQQLIRFDTTNPPGNEAACIAYIGEILGAVRCESRAYARDPQRPNLVARLPGEGRAAPLLLYGHVDVVPTAGQSWTHDPFGGAVVDGEVWGRGALDMKAGVAMMLTAFLRAHAEGLRPPGDVILAVVSDEEDGGDEGAGFLVSEHPELFEGVRFALGEFGGFSTHVDGARFYPIQVIEKQMCWLKATVRGPGGHGALPMRGGAMARLGRLLAQLDRARLPVHVHPIARRMIETMAERLGPPRGLVLKAALDPRLADVALRAMGERGRELEPMLRNTVNATIVRGGAKVNVIPSELELELDGRLLPGVRPEDLLHELRPLVGEDVELDVVRHDPGPSQPDLTLFDTLGGILRELDPEAVPVPYLTVGVTDGRFFGRLGIQTYGFLPLRLPEGFHMAKLIHAADERVPIEALDFGVEALYRAIQRFG
jgi:acetylornithine deacetylase/succinyl-diaminopimelate desuccinylase-like protein